MNEGFGRVGATNPATYTIELEGHLDPARQAWFEGFTLSNGYDESGAPVCTLTGEARDQAMLHGILARVRDMGLSLISVRRNPLEES